MFDRKHTFADRFDTYSLFYLKQCLYCVIKNNWSFTIILMTISLINYKRLVNIFLFVINLKTFKKLFNQNNFFYSIILKFSFSLNNYRLTYFFLYSIQKRDN